MNRIMPSRYAYDKSCTISKTTLTGEPRNNVPSPFEEIIIGALQKYGFLTLPLIQRAVSMKHDKKISAQKAVNKMQKQGKIEKYTIKYPEGNPDCDVYVLSGEMRKKYGSKSVFRYDMSNIPYILEHLSLAQWHISVLEGKETKEAAFCKQVGAGQFITQMPSLIEFKTSFGKKMYICGMTAPKGTRKEDLGRFLTSIITIDKYLARNKYRFKSYVLAVICESEAQIEEVSLILQNMAELQEMYIVYCLDIITGDEETDPLSMIYDVDREMGEARLSVLKLRG